LINYLENEVSKKYNGMVSKRQRKIKNKKILKNII